MALFLRQNEERSKLQERLAAELQERLKQNTSRNDGGYVDGIEDSTMMEGTRATSSHAWIWIFVFFVVLVIVGIIIFY